MSTALDQWVQAELRDTSKHTVDRAVMAVAQIEKQVLAEAGLEPGTLLPVPPEWEHKVPRATSTEVYGWPLAEVTPWTDEDDHIFKDFWNTESEPKKRWWRR